MHNLAAHIDGRTEGFQGDFDNVDGAHHSGAETTRFEQQHPLLGGVSPGGIATGNGVEDSCGHTNKYTNGGVETIGEKWGWRDMGNHPRAAPIYDSSALYQSRRWTIGWIGGPFLIRPRAHAEMQFAAGNDLSMRDPGAVPLLAVQLCG